MHWRRRSNSTWHRTKITHHTQTPNNPIVTKTVDFYFDFSSPYGYFSSEVIDDFASGCECEVVWRPYLMGAVMKVTGRKPLVQIPMINDYSKHDLYRVARYHGIEFNLPSVFPIATVAACRAFYSVADTHGANAAQQLAHQFFRAYFVNDIKISDVEVIVEIAVQAGFDADEIAMALENPEVKRKVRTATDSAIEKQVFGSPFFVVDGEPFWGHDRLNHLEAWIKSGGW